MKSPIWEASPGALMASLFPANAHADRAFARFDLYTFSTVNGPVLRYAAADIDIAYGGNTWSSKQVRVDTEQSKPLAHWKVGLDVDTWQIVMFPRPVDEITGAVYPDAIGSVPWLSAVRAGALDGATATVDRAYFALPLSPNLAAASSPVGVLRIFAGRVAEVDAGRSGAVISINSHLELLGIQMPRNLFQAPCRHRLFDAGCTLNAASYATNVTLQSSGAPSTLGCFVPAFTIPGSGTLNLGRIVFTSNLNAGFSRTIRYYNPNFGSGLFALEFLSPVPNTIYTGDTATIYPGCEKTLSACALFNNTANYGGTPYIPSPETAV